MNWQEVSCGGSARSAVTHTSGANKTAPVSLVWSPPSDGRGGGGSGGGGQVVFVATVVQSFDTYWVGIYSEALDLPTAAEAAMSPSPTAGTGAAITTTASLPLGSATGNGAVTTSELLTKREDGRAK